MKLEHEFTVPAAIDDAWQVLLDVERIAPCMPGAALTGMEGDEFTGTVKVKVGPIQVTYKGQAKFTEKDEAAHRAVIEASGKEARGGGTAAATITAVLASAGADRTTVQVETDLNITGRPAQFGRGVMADVGAKLVGQFADCLAEELAGGSAAPAPQPVTETPVSEPASADATAVLPTPEPPRPTPVAPRREAEPIDLLDVAGSSVAKRVAPIAAAVVVFFLLVLRRRRRRH